MRRTFATLLLLATLAPAAPPAAAAPAAGREVVLSGSRSASVEVRFASRFKPHLGVFGYPGISAATRGTYAGVLFENLGKRMLSQGGVVVPVMGDEMPIGWGGSDRDDFSLPAGRYRVHLLTDGQSTVRVRVDGIARSMRLAPRRPTAVRARLVSVDAVRAEVPVLVRPTTTTVLVAYAKIEPSAGNAVSVCLDEGRELPCEAGGGSGMKVAFLAPGVWSKSQAAIFFYPGWASNGEHVARYTMAAAGGAPALYAFALSVD